MASTASPSHWFIGEDEAMVDTAHKPADEIEAVVIRMYRGILGDCFLIRIKRGVTWQHILIDCGVLQNVASGDAILAKLPAEVKEQVGVERLKAVQAGPELIDRIAKDVITTVGKRIDLLVLTHEHFDHFSGFALADKTFTAADVAIDRLWLAWTEDPEDPRAIALHTRFDKGKQALALAVQLSQMMGVAVDDRLQTAAALAAFVGPVDRGFAAGGVKTGRATIQMLKDKAGVQATRYLEPGQIVDALGLKAYVLGPPRDEKRLEKDNPSSGAAKEVYLTSLDEALAVESTMRARLTHEAGAAADIDTAPFAQPHLQRGGDDSKEKAALRRLYEGEEQEYRRIDGEWTATAETLALKMDADTNNTSLALAFELGDGQVLLFPGDAQVGNWLSWGDQTYPRQVTAGGPPAVTIDDLLRRTTFYKVGHHASHNATLRQLGLEKMTDPRLTAAIPVVEAVAAIQGPGSKAVGKGWKMPYGDLYRDLKRRTQDRIVRGDGDPVQEQRAFAAAPTDAHRPVVVSHEPTGLWVELTFAFSNQREQPRPAKEARSTRSSLTSRPGRKANTRRS
jgi:beta-lactamase superfamily II metal-dependent hydrolase